MKLLLLSIALSVLVLWAIGCAQGGSLAPGQSGTSDPLTTAADADFTIT